MKDPMSGPRDRAPSATDKSTQPPTRSSTVNNDTTRGGKAAATPRTLGPRCA